MLNRTNRTLSANLNRLNLGTRSLAIVAGLNNGVSTLRTRHVHRVVKRDEMGRYQPMPIPIGPELIFPISSSSSVPPGHVSSSPVVPQRVDFAAASFPDGDRHCHHREVQGHSLERCWQQQEAEKQERSKRDRQAIKAERLRVCDDLGARLARRTLAAAAAATAAAGG